MEKVNTPNDTKVVILRGPSGSGKSTIADLVRKKVPDIALIEQDYVSEVVYSHQPGFKEATRDTIVAMTRTALRHGKRVILDGIFNAQYYESALSELDEENNSIIFVYLEVPFEETVRRHSMRSKADLFGEKEMQEWFGRAAPLDHPKEVIRRGDQSAEEVAQEIMELAGWI